MFLIENSLRAAQRDGIAPSFGNDVSTEQRSGTWEGYRRSTTAPQHDPTGENKRFTQFMEDRIAQQKLAKQTAAEDKQAKLLALLEELTAGEQGYLERRIFIAEDLALIVLAGLAFLITFFLPGSFLVDLLSRTASALAFIALRCLSFANVSLVC